VEYEVPSVDTAMKILKVLSRSRYKSCSLKEIAELVNVNKTTCLRILRTLERHDAVKYDPQRKQYSLGPYLVPLGRRALDLNSHLATATAELPVIARQTGLTTVLIRRVSPDRVMYLAVEEPPGDHPKLSVAAGQQFPLAAVAFGRCFLAYEDESSWQDYIHHGLVRYTPQSIVDPEEFVAVLRKTRQDGYSVSHGSLTPGISAVASPIFNHDGQVELVIACLAMTAEMTAEREQAVVSVLQASTRRLSELNDFDAALTSH